jgi:hypothetical protein
MKYDGRGDGLELFGGDSIPSPTSGMDRPPKNSSISKALLLGVGLDSDGHQRLTTGKNFALVGGSKETHEEMTEKVTKINEKLKAKGKELNEVSREEFDDIAHDVGLRRDRPEQN